MITMHDPYDAMISTTFQLALLLSHLLLYIPVHIPGLYKLYATCPSSTGTTAYFYSAPQTLELEPGFCLSLLVCSVLLSP